MSRILVGMSGGVDSAVTAYLLSQKGHEVIGVTLRLWDEIDPDAARAADFLGIKHYVCDVRHLFKEKVQTVFCQSYLKGHTPNPCIMCNASVKFASLISEAEKLGCDMIATGHYAQILHKDGEHIIKTAKDSKKDQSYVLCSLEKKFLPYILFPLGEYTKEEIRQTARNINYISPDKPDSQEICFIPDNDYASFVERFTGQKMPEGDIINKEGKILGRHFGIHKYTIGQRKGLGAFSKPMFVIGIDASANKVIIGEKGEEYSNRLYIDNVNILSDELVNTSRANVKIRYAAPFADADIKYDGQGISVLFDKPCRAITPGQWAAVYKGDTLLGGGIIV